MDLASVVFASVFVPSDAALLSLHLAATAAMFGLIWFVQVVHCPLFAAVGGDGFVSYETAHRRRTVFAVGPLMAAEGLTGIARRRAAGRPASGWRYRSRAWCSSA